jgi:hypothetical protein
MTYLASNLFASLVGGEYVPGRETVLFNPARGPEEPFDAGSVNIDIERLAPLVGRAVSLCGVNGSMSGASSMPIPPPATGYRFSVALSFPGEHRGYVSRVDAVLANAIGPDKVFYDERFISELARLNLDTHLQDIYRNKSAIIVVFSGSDYARKQWCGIEWRAIRDIIKNRRDEDVIPVRMDDGEVPGIFSIDGYLDGMKFSAEKVAELILERLRSRTSVA